MAEKAEWAIVDEPYLAPQPTLAEAMRAWLGPGWRWKLAATAAVACLLVAFVITLTSILILVLLIATVTVLGLRKLRSWLQFGNDGQNARLEPRKKSQS